MNKTESIIFTIDSVIFASAENNYKIIKPRNIKYIENAEEAKKNCIIKGCIPSASPGDCYEAECRWVNNPKYGWQLDIVTAKKSVLKNKRSIKSFLVKNIKSVGSVTAEKIIKKFGNETINILINNPEQLAAVEGVGKKKAENIIEDVQNYFALNELIEFLGKLGFTDFGNIVKISEKFGRYAVDKIKENPYVIAPSLPFSAFPQVDSLAIQMGIAVNSKERLSKVISYYLAYRAAEGNSYVNIEDIYKDMYYFMVRKGLDVKGIKKDDIDSAVCESELHGSITLEDTGNDMRVYLAKYYHMETEIISMLNELNKEKQPVLSEVIDKFCKEYSQKQGITLSDEQKIAVKAAAENRFFILTGLAGAGKTSAVNAILAYIKSTASGKRKADITLCAPTGRAAKRITEVTGLPACTIHRLLGLRDEEKSDVNGISAIESDYLIVDESSMIDLPLFYMLLFAIKDNKKITLIMVGDENQLAPVGTGFPFRDIVKSEAYPHVRLTKLFRQAAESQINSNANAVLNGFTPFVCDISKQDFFVFDKGDNISELIRNTYISLITDGRENPDDIVILSPVKKTAEGVINLNNIIQNIINPGRESYVKTAEYELRLNDRVMQIVNNYDKGVYNGDIGKVSRIDREKKMMTVTFSDYEVQDEKVVKIHKEVVYLFDELTELTLAYAMTVHKSQGSEFPCVIIAASKAHINLTRSLIYTAITRAKKRVIIAGEVNAIYAGINKEETLIKKSGILYKLTKGQKT